MKRIFAASLALLFVPGATFAQQLISPAQLRPVSTRQNPPAEPPAAEAGADDAAANEEEAKDGEEKEDALDFLNKDVAEVRQTAVANTAMSAEVSSVSRTATPLSKTPAAIYVVTNEMIRRSGARTLPDVLRTVPGLSVAQIRANTWAVSSRGQTGEFANKMLVQIDGRAIYNNIFAGTYWDINPVPFEDIDRIEIIRGPGATVWGANAVNGVINIVTKDSKDTQGAFVELGGGSVEKMFSTARYGGSAGDSTTYRIYGNQLERDAGAAQPGVPFEYDEYGYGQGGFRIDTEVTDADLVTVSGDFLNARNDDIPAAGVFAQTRNNSRANNINARWLHTIDDETDWSVQTYYDELARQTRFQGSGLPMTDVEQQVVSVDFQYRFQLAPAHAVVWGLSYRNSDMLLDFHPTDPLSSQAIPPRSRFWNAGVFVQDTITLSEDLLYATVGIKLEDNAYTDLEYQPSGRLVYTPNEQRSYWAAYSRAVRLPSLLDRSIQYATPVGPGMISLLRGNNGLNAEVVNTYEVGMRSQPTENFYWDITGYYFKYNDLVTYSNTGIQPGVPTIVFSDLNNLGSSDNAGMEIAGTWDVNSRWELRGGYSFLVEDAELNGAFNYFAVQPGMAPRNQFFLVSSHDLDACTQFDLIGRYVDSLDPTFANPPQHTPSYIELDARIARQIGRSAEVALVGRNLLDSHHLEFANGTQSSTEVKRSVYGMMTIRY